MLSIRDDSRLLSLYINHFNQYTDEDERNTAIHALESGSVIYLPHLTFQLSDNEKYLLSPKFADHKSKNISFNIANEKLRGAKGSTNDIALIHVMMKRFCLQTIELLHNLFPQYEASLEVGRTSYRPIEIKDRVSSYKKNDTLLHVDAFPATPSQGKRILRVFSNINPHGQSRVWRLGEAFEKVARRYLNYIPKPLPGSSTLMDLVGITKSRRSEYDHIMLHLHDKMKADQQYQQEASQITMPFEANQTWIVFTDQVSHAAISGQYLLEQTFYLPVEAMCEPDRSPLKVLEKLTGKNLL